MSQTEQKHTRHPIIATEGLVKTFDAGKFQAKAIRGVDLQIYPQDFCVLFGPSGSGKSTLLNMLVGLEKPTEGNVFIDGKRVGSLSDDERSTLRSEYFGIVYQQPIWIKALSVIDNVALPLLIDGVQPHVARRDAHAVLKEVGMASFVKYRPAELSGGQQQRVGLARALIKKTPLIILDEPTGNLDTDTADQIMALLQNLNREHKRTIVMVTHNLDYLDYATRTIKIENGLIRKMTAK